MDDSMVTARMLDEKKRKGARILAREGLSASQAINLMYTAEEGHEGDLLQLYLLRGFPSSRFEPYRR